MCQKSINDLPEIALEMILSWLSYDEIAKCRAVCKTFDEKCKQLLNRAPNLVDQRCNQYLYVIKPQLPRRESAKNRHPLLATYYAVDAIRISTIKLYMMYEKYIKQNSCCFIPGKIIDESFEIIRDLKEKENCGDPLNFNDLQAVLEEFKDLKIMATEHFEESIKPRLDLNYKEDYLREVVLSPWMCHGEFGHDDDETWRAPKRAKPSSPTGELTGTEYFAILHDLYSKITEHESKLQEYVNKIVQQESKIREYSKEIQNQDLKIKNYLKKIANQDTKMAEYTKLFENQQSKLHDQGQKILSIESQFTRVSKLLENLNQKLVNSGVIRE
ncbi:F-box only protein 28-like [Phymastichus coffea]|uniref:F-box only protein 28-like n=1 Tax=Phymastichus coffea TaxID=108790 RepID=UPI00273CDE03|nr:F-box only protein 28-like [Phymastichus coffea]